MSQTDNSFKPPNKKTSDFLVTPVDRSYFSRTKKFENELDQSMDAGIENIIDMIRKDFCGDENETLSSYEDSTQSCSPMEMPNFRQPPETKSSANLVSSPCSQGKLDRFSIINMLSGDIRKDFSASPNCAHAKIKVLKPCNFMKKNWRNKLENFKFTSRSKIISKINFLKNNKINYFNLGINSVGNSPTAKKKGENFEFMKKKDAPFTLNYMNDANFRPPTAPSRSAITVNNFQLEMNLKDVLNPPNERNVGEMKRNNMKNYSSGLNFFEGERYVGNAQSGGNNQNVGSRLSQDVNSPMSSNCGTDFSASTCIKNRRYNNVLQRMKQNPFSN